MVQIKMVGGAALRIVLYAEAKPIFFCGEQMKCCMRRQKSGLVSCRTDTADISRNSAAAAGYSAAM